MFWDPLFERVSSLVGAPPSELKMVSGFLLAYPLAAIYVRLPANRPNLSHIFSIAVSTFYFVPLLGIGWGYMHLLLDCAVTYGIVVGSRDRRMPWVVFGFVMGHLMCNHFINTVWGVDPEKIDITFSQMVLSQKLTTLAWNVADGRSKAEDLDDTQKATRLLHVPSPLAFLGYCLFFPSVLVGPASDYATYDALVLKTLFVAPPGASSDQATATKRRTPYGRRRVAYLHLGIGLAFMGIFAIFGTKAAYARILEPKWYGWSKATRFGFVQFAGVMARTKYYGAWSLTEGACILTGIGFNGYDPKTGRTLWNRVKNVQIISIETAESFKVLFDSWNCRTNVWLRDCVYKRMVTKGKKPGTKESMSTFLTSAVWHGIWPGYYLAFITAGVATSLGRQFRHFVRPYFLPSPSATQTSPNALPQYPYPNLLKRVYDVLGWSMVQINLNYMASSFVLLRLGDCMKAYMRMYWYSHILLLLAFGFFQLGGRRFLRRELQARGLAPTSSKAAKAKTDLKATAAEAKNGSAKRPVPSLEISPPSPPHDERDPKDLRWIRHALESPDRDEDGRSKGEVGGWVDDALQRAEPPWMAGTPSERSFGMRKEE